jgi:hypothetical protein
MDVRRMMFAATLAVRLMSPLPTTVDDDPLPQRTIGAATFARRVAREHRDRAAPMTVVTAALTSATSS